MRRRTKITLNLTPQSQGKLTREKPVNNSFDVYFCTKRRRPQKSAWNSARKHTVKSSQLAAIQTDYSVTTCQRFFASSVDLEIKSAGNNQSLEAAHDLRGYLLLAQTPVITFRNEIALNHFNNHHATTTWQLCLRSVLRHVVKTCWFFKGQDHPGRTRSDQSRQMLSSRSQKTGCTWTLIVSKKLTNPKNNRQRLHTSIANIKAQVQSDDRKPLKNVHRSEVSHIMWKSDIKLHKTTESEK